MDWKDITKKIKQQMSELLEIPSEILLDLPKVILLGNLQLVIENHRGILKYTSELIYINLSDGELVVKGRDLRLRNVLPEEICIEGRIKSISFDQNNEI